MKLLVTGSRDIPDLERAERLIEEWARETFDPATLAVEVIHGAARGIDSLAAGIARKHGAAVTAVPVAEVDRARAREIGAAYLAPIKRNERMLDLEPDRVIAFWDGRSTGTEHTIKEARRRGIPVTTYEL